MILPAVTFSKEQLLRFGEVIEQEWLLTNGLGGYASSSVLGINTRKYHGLLVAALNPPGERTVCLEKLDEDLLVGNETFRLGANEFGDTIFPQGYKLIEEFQLAPYPTYRYNIGNVALQKTIFLPQKKNSVTVLYQVTNHNNSEAKIRLFPLLNCRYYHNVTDNTRAPLHFAQKASSKSVQVTFQNTQVTTNCQTTEGQFVASLNWVQRLHYRDESSRGEASFEDCFQPGYFEVALPPRVSKGFAFSCAVSRTNLAAAMLPASIQDSQAALAEETNYKDSILTEFYQTHPYTSHIARQR